MTSDTLAYIPESVRNDLAFWTDLLAPVLDLSKGIGEALTAISRAKNIPYSTVERKFHRARKHGLEALVNRAKCGPSAWHTSEQIALSQSDKDLVKTYVERNQRKALPAVRALRRDWVRGKVTTTTPIDVATGYPRGWSESNLARHKPTRYELQVSRHGRSAAANERRLVYTTRANLYVGSHYLFDDIWHDHFCNVLDLRKTGRPLEFHALDLYSANKFAWGMRVRTEGETGKMEGLKEADMRFLLASVLGGTGYSARGTTLVVEHGTAAIREDLERMLHDETSGIITVARSGMEGASAAAHQYAGRSKGNFRFKSALETLGNLIHNEMAALPGQTGKDRDHRPEQLHGLLRYNDALLMAVSQLDPARAEMLKWPLLTIQQFQIIAGEIYARINARTDHDLEGWDLHYTPDRRTGLMRRLSPTEVWRPCARQLTRLRPEAIALILLKDNGVERMTKRGMFELTESEISGDILRFDARVLGDRDKYLTLLNPFDPSSIFAFDSKGRFAAACPRIHSADRGDVDAMHRACGAAAKAESETLQPYRLRHLAEAREKRFMHANNDAVLSGRPVTIEEKSRAAENNRLARTVGPSAIEDMLESHSSQESHTSHTEAEEIPW